VVARGECWRYASAEWGGAVRLDSRADDRAVVRGFATPICEALRCERCEVTADPTDEVGGWLVVALQRVILPDGTSPVLARSICSTCSRDVDRVKWSSVTEILERLGYVPAPVGAG
jgi:hypothetical protein